MSLQAAVSIAIESRCCQGIDALLKHSISSLELCRSSRRWEIATTGTGNVLLLGTTLAGSTEVALAHSGGGNGE